MLALTHRSFAHENGGIPTNERLEFLGDTVLGLVVTETLYRRHPDLSEGELAKMRAATVSQKSLAAIARRLGLGQYVLLGKGEIRTRGNDKDSILSDTVEAIIGAVYLRPGPPPPPGPARGPAAPTLAAAAGLGAGLDGKTSLQEAAAAAGLSAPSYSSDAVGPDHARVFTSYVHLDGRLYGTGSGTAKKYAEQEAAERAYRALAAEQAEREAASAASPVAAEDAGA